MTLKKPKTQLSRGLVSMFSFASFGAGNIGQGDDDAGGDSLSALSASRKKHISIIQKTSAVSRGSPFGSPIAAKSPLDQARPRPSDPPETAGSTTRNSLSRSRPFSVHRCAHHRFTAVPGGLQTGHPSRGPSLDPLIAGFWVFLGSSCKGIRVIDRGFRVWFF